MGRPRTNAREKKVYTLLPQLTPLYVWPGGHHDGINSHCPKQVKWDRVNNVNVLGWELGQSPRSCIASWNCQVQQWLYNYVYVRSFYTVEVSVSCYSACQSASLILFPIRQVFDEKTQKTIKITKRPWYSTLYTNLISAFWHGFYPGYYLGFARLSSLVNLPQCASFAILHLLPLLS